jgi:lincosamide nucleotidyltransferase A/C/D/E
VHWLDGGWGVDALVGDQTRAHGDIDLVVARERLPAVRALLDARGYRVLRDRLPTALAVRDTAGREVDHHPVDLEPDGGGEQVLPGGTRWRYGPPALGTVAGRAVRCASAADQVRMHDGYELRDVDRHDLRLLRRLQGGGA